MAETGKELVLGEGRLDEDVLGVDQAGTILWRREPGPPSKVKRGSSMKAVLKCILAAGPTGLAVNHKTTVGAALESAVRHHQNFPDDRADPARRSRQATAQTMSRAGLLVVRRGATDDDGNTNFTFTLTTAGRAMAEDLMGQKPGQDLDELATRPWIVNFERCATATDDDRRMGATAPHAAGAECFGLATWPDEQTLINSTVGPNFSAQKISVRVGSKIVPADFVHSYRLRSSGTDLPGVERWTAAPQVVPIDREHLADDLDRTSRFLSENRVHPQPTEPFHVEAALQYLTPRDLAAVLEWLEEEGGKEASGFSRSFMMESGKTGVELVLGLLLWMADHTWSGNANGARRSWAYMNIRRFSAMTLQSVIDLDTLQIAAAMPRSKVPVNDGTPDGEAGGSKD